MIRVQMIDKVTVVDLINDPHQQRPPVNSIRKKNRNSKIVLVFLALPNNHYTTMMAYPPTNYDTPSSFNDQDRDESIDSFKTDDRSSKGTSTLFR